MFSEIPLCNDQLSMEPVGTEKLYSVDIFKYCYVILIKLIIIIRKRNNILLDKSLSIQPYFIPIFIPFSHFTSISHFPRTTQPNILLAVFSRYIK